MYKVYTCEPTKTWMKVFFWDSELGDCTHKSTHFTCLLVFKFLDPPSSPPNLYHINIPYTSCGTSYVLRHIICRFCGVVVCVLGPAVLGYTCVRHPLHSAAIVALHCCGSPFYCQYVLYTVERRARPRPLGSSPNLYHRNIPHTLCGTSCLKNLGSYPRVLGPSKSPSLCT